MRRSVGTVRPQLKSVVEAASEDSYREVVAKSNGYEVVMRQYTAPGQMAVIMVGGVGGDFDSPAKDLYPRLACALQRSGIGTLRVQFRDPVDLDESTADVMLGIEVLRSNGSRRVGLLGHSFGGAVAIQAALRSPDVATVVTLATQGFGTEGVEDLAPRSILLVHGYDDEVLPPVCSIDAYDRAAQPKSLKLLEGARHGLNESADEVFRLVNDWLLRELRAQQARQK